MEPAGWHRLFVEPRRPASIRDRENAYWLAVGAVCIGAFMGQLDASIVTVALPTLQRTFDASVGAVTWVGLSYLLVLVATVTAVGRFADMWGRKLLYVYGFAVFVIGSALCGVAPTLGVLIAFRVLQAIGAAMLQANSVAIIVIRCLGYRWGRRSGSRGGPAIGLALGPSVGGLLLAVGGWRLIFMINVPFGVLGVVAGLLLIPRSLSPQARGCPRLEGLVDLLPGRRCRPFSLSFANTYGWTSPLIIGAFVLGLCLVTGFVMWETRFPPHARPRPVPPGRVSVGHHQRAPVLPGHLRRSLSCSVLPPARSRDRRGPGGSRLMMMPFVLGCIAPFAGRLADRLGLAHSRLEGCRWWQWGCSPWAPATGHRGLPRLACPHRTRARMLHPAQQCVDHGICSSTAIRLGFGGSNMTRGMGTALGLALTGVSSISPAGRHRTPIP